MAEKTPIPNFRNLGVQIRTALVAEGLRLLHTTVDVDDWRQLGRAFLSGAPLFEPVLLTTMAMLALLGPWLLQHSYRTGIAVSLFVTSLATGGWLWLGHLLLPTSPQFHDAARAVLVALLTTGAVLIYFNWRHHRQSPAWAESRLMALQSRIRPHFLFNSLNSVLALIRAEPRKAEAMLEDLAELFRALLAEPRALVPLSDELALARAYLAIEGIRLGERLRVVWQVEPGLDATLVPPLLLQPLLENAVRYGVEPLAQGADIRVEVARAGKDLLLTVHNPCPAAGQAVEGNRMALANIAERLSLHFDAEAQLKTSVDRGEHIARVRLPITR